MNAVSAFAPHQRGDAPGAHGGWGLRIVGQLADDWRVTEGSTKVWFRLKPPRAAS